jgi:hypothetical protein
MNKKKYYLFLLLFSASVLQAEECEIETDPFRLTLKHIESKGIGYPIGYTTMGVFYGSTEAWRDPWIPFLDLRGHLFNNGRSAINAGVGIRMIASRVWGAYGYYDYRRTFHTHYDQISFGLESLGRIWDFRLGAYIPFGIKVRKEDVALQTFTAEAAIHVNSFKGAPLYFASGPYYLNNDGISAWGMQLRGFVEMYKHIRLEANISYDHLFKWIGQGQLGILFLFGGKKETREKKNRSCETMNILQQRALQRIDRNEIIPLYRKKGIL